MSYQLPPDSELLLRLPNVALGKDWKPWTQAIPWFVTEASLVCDFHENRFVLVSHLAEVLQKSIRI